MSSVQKPPHFRLDAAFTDNVITVIRAAGDAILAIYAAADAGCWQAKSDLSPLTAADLAAHQLLVRELPRLLDLPIISEESGLPAWSERQAWQAYWLIDPLDGTKEFLARNGQFTVNIALVIQGVPRLGLVHVPVADETYLGLDSSLAAQGQTRAEKYQGGVKCSILHSRPLAPRLAQQLPLDVLMSLRHGSPEQAAWVAKLQQRWPAPLNAISAGSSLKFCWLAEGRADLYPRLGPTCEWDTAAASAVLLAAGGAILRLDTLAPLICNQQESVLNPSFIALGDASYPWAKLLA